MFVFSGIAAAWSGLSMAWRFFNSPLGRIVGAGLIAAAIYGTGYLRGSNKAETRCQEAAVRAELAAAQRDLAIQRAAAEFARKKADELSKAKDDLDQKVSEYEADLQKQGHRCPLSADDVKRLRNIR